jgi:hypothetical protein
VGAATSARLVFTRPRFYAQLGFGRAGQLIVEGQKRGEIAVQGQPHGAFNRESNLGKGEVTSKPITP